MEETTEEVFDVDAWLEENEVDESKRFTFEAGGRTFSAKPAADMQVMWDIAARAEQWFKTAKSGNGPKTWKPWIPKKQTTMTMAAFVTAKEFDLKVLVNGELRPTGIDVTRALKMGRTCGSLLSEIANPLMEQKAGAGDGEDSQIKAYADASEGEEAAITAEGNG